jgi:RNA processing factor Prp31
MAWHFPEISKLMKKVEKEILVITKFINNHRCLGGQEYSQQGG